MGVADKDPSYTESWWRSWNSAFIWATVSILIILVFVTSNDPANPGQFTQFGANQVLILGFITVLLLFKYISKIKIGPVEIDFKPAADALEKAHSRLKSVDLTTLTRSGQDDIKDAMNEVGKAQGALEQLKKTYARS